MEGSRSAIAWHRAAVAGVLAILAAKLFLAARININWDEFHFLANVHALARGELDLLLQGAYTHLFTWITGSGAQEADQVVTLRLWMCLLLAVSAALLYRLARRQSAPFASAVAVFAFLESWPVLLHGASFRADSMLLPLTLAALLLASGAPSWRRSAAAGACLGLAFVVTTKAVLMLPPLVLVAACAEVRSASGNGASWWRIARRLAWMAAVATAVAGALLAAHALSVAPSAEQTTAFADRTLRTAFLDVPFLPRRDYLVALVREDPALWTAIVAGLLLAVRGRQFGAAACAAALLPVLFYRNAFPYYFPIMLAPACVLVAVLVDSIDRWLGGLPRASYRNAGAAIVLAVPAAGAWDHFMTLRFDGQSGQRAVIAAVHQIFPEPAPYVDHSGMIASFPKGNFLMSSWGVQDYRRRDRPFMPDVLGRVRAPLLVENHSVLRPGTLLFRGLHPVDQALISSSYIDYWGPVRVAGAELRLPAVGRIDVTLPVAGRYRVESDGALTIDGIVVTTPTIVETDARRPLAVATVAPAEELTVRFVWAEARPPPAEPPPSLPLYAPL